MTTLRITNEASRQAAAEFIGGLSLEKEWDVEVKRHVHHRSIPQNKLQRLWCNEVSAQLGDRTPEQVRGESKLWFGVPILRHGNQEFAELYDSRIKGLPYETKLMLMMSPFDIAVTSLMNAKQMTQYLNDMHDHWTAQGVVLTLPAAPTEKRG